MTARIIDGTKISQELKAGLKLKVEEYRVRGLRAPCLSVVLVGEDPASQIYVGHKEKGCLAIGVESKTLRLPANSTQAELNKALKSLNDDSGVDGILLQLPLPKGLNKDEAIDQISPEKDVDGLTVVNQGRLVCQREGLFCCTPLGCIELIKRSGVSISGLRAVVIGRSLLVGSPVRTMLMNEGATVTTLHSKSRDVEAITREADIVVAAVGVPKIVKKEWIKPGAVVIDVGMHRDENNKLVGDVAFEELLNVAGAITPVPGGVGPMTIAMLLANCVKAFEMSHRL